MAPRQHDRESERQPEHGPSWRAGAHGGRAEQSPDDYHVPYFREPASTGWHDSDLGPDASPDDFDDINAMGDERGTSHRARRADASERSRHDEGQTPREELHRSPEKMSRHRDSGRRRDPYDFSKAGPYSTPPPYRTGGPDYLGREETYERGGEHFIGRGPKDYERSPERIREDICERLTFSPYVDASETKIQVLENGLVHLTGRVDSRRTKRIVEDICDTVYGVRDVKNELEIDESQSRS
ncbi:BON domain-containing protein [Persicimonas caeni]|nr:BON domain-containing protein [Persicimonas caeni]